VKRLTLSLFTLALLLCTTPLFARGKLQGWVERGGQKVTINNGLQSTSTFQRSYPGATVTVKLAGTSTNATIYSDAAGTAKSNPFSADSSGFWFFYAEDGCYDVSFSGTTAYTLSDMCIANQSLASCGSSGDDTARLQALLDVSKHVTIPSGTTCRFTQLTIAQNDVTLELSGGATLQNTNATDNKQIIVSGARVSVIGSGRILSPARWNGLNARQTEAVLWVSGNDFSARGITLENVPRVGFFFDDTVGAKIVDVTINGNYPSASYTGVETGHAAILYDYPATTEKNPSLIVANSNINTSVQGIITANYDDASFMVGLTITGNHFNQCWDHAIYTSSIAGSLSTGHTIVGNTMLNCKFPIVTSGQSAVVAGNTLHATETTGTPAQQMISVRDSIGGVITGNTLYGLAPSILADAVNGTEIRDTIISNNTITSISGTGLAAQAIRMCKDAESCTNNKIVGNVINTAHTGTSDGAIWLTMKTNAFTGYGNEIKDNIVKVSNVTKNVLVQYQTNATISGNTLESTATAGGATTVYMLDMYQVTQMLVEHNTFLWRTGGTNITVRGVQDDGVGANNTLRNNRFVFTAALAGEDPIGLVTTDFELSRNQLTEITAFTGLFTWANGNPSVVVSVPNIVSTSKVTITPMNAAGGLAMSDRKPYVTIVAGTSFTLQSHDGSNIVGDGLFAYQVQ
jgi:hypothetical protein